MLSHTCGVSCEPDTTVHCCDAFTCAVGICFLALYLQLLKRRLHMMTCIQLVSLFPWQATERFVIDGSIWRHFSFLTLWNPANGKAINRCSFHQTDVEWWAFKMRLIEVSEYWYLNTTFKTNQYLHLSTPKHMKTNHQSDFQSTLQVALFVLETSYGPPLCAVFFMRLTWKTYCIFYVLIAFF